MTRPEPGLVKPPQSRRGRGVSYVTLQPAAEWQAGSGRVFVKHQQNYWCRPVWRGFRRTPMLLRELRGLKACQRLGINVPQIVAYHNDAATSQLVLAEVIDAQPLDAALAETDADRQAIITQVAEVIGRLHRAGWSHGALYPHHILISRTSGHQVTLIDLEKTRWNPFKRTADLDRFWRHAPMLTEPERNQFASGYRSARARQSAQHPAQEKVSSSS